MNSGLLRGCRACYRKVSAGCGLQKSMAASISRVLRFRINTILSETHLPVKIFWIRMYPKNSKFGDRELQKLDRYFWYPGTRFVAHFFSFPHFFVSLAEDCISHRVKNPPGPFLMLSYSKIGSLGFFHEELCGRSNYTGVVSLSHLRCQNWPHVC